MAVTLVVEDGTGKADANTYVSLADVRAFATQRGISVSSDDDVLGAQIILAADYVEGFTYEGERATDEQALSWPRECTDFDEDVIPPSLMRAQTLLVIEQAQGVNLFPTATSGKFVKRRKVGPIETEYSENINVDGRPSFPQVDRLLEPLFSGLSGIALQTIRV